MELPKFSVGDPPGTCSVVFFYATAGGEGEGLAYRVQR